MLAVPNVVTSWSRAVYDPTTPSVQPNTVTLANVAAHAAIIPSQSFHELPASARKSSYVFQVDPGTDIVTGDQMASCVDLYGNPWPNDYPMDPGDPGYGFTIWTVRFHRESTPGPGAYRELFVEKTQIGGPASPF